MARLCQIGGDCFIQYLDHKREELSQRFGLSQRARQLGRSASRLGTQFFELFSDWALMPPREVVIARALLHAPK